MPATAVIGGQWGDEGKGKIVDFMAQDADIVVRYAGGGNAGHTVENDNGKFALRIVPVGMLNQHTRLNIIGRGAVPELGIVTEELLALKEKGIDVSRLRIDERAHLVMPWHVAQDRLREEEKRRFNKSIGTTGNGIGPCYADKALRESFRAGDLIDLDLFYERFKRRYKDQVLYLHRYFIAHFNDCDGCDTCNSILHEEYTFKKVEKAIEVLASIEDGFRGSGRISKDGLHSIICDAQPLIWDALDEGQKVLLEGAQGFLLDIDHGIDYPYVTSSATGVASALQSSGVPISELTERIGVIKAYCTRVGEGPFPTEMGEISAQEIREKGQEYGTVTGRPRRCGWFDRALFYQVIRANGLSGSAITRLDILDDMNTIYVGENVGRRKIELVPFAGWGPGESVKGCRTWESLPQRAKAYCNYISKGLPIKYISVGPKREETIVL